MKLQLSQKQTMAKSLLLLTLLGLSSVFVIVEIPGVRAASEFTGLQTFLTGVNPDGVATVPALDHIYVADAGDDSLLVMSDQSNAVIATVNLSPGTSPKAVAANAVSGDVYVADSGSDTVSRIDSANVLIGSVIVGSDPVAIAVNSGTGEIYVADSGSDTVSVISSVSNNVVATVPVGNDPDAIAVDPSSGDVWVANSGSDTVSVISEANTVIATVSAGVGPDAIAVDTASRDVYVAAALSDSVEVISEATDSVSATIGVFEPNAIVFSPSTEDVYVTSSGEDLLTVINALTETTMASYVFGASPLAIGFDPNIGTVYIGTNLGNIGEIFVISFASLSPSVSAGPTGTTVTLSGTGFLANNPYEICLDTPASSIPGIYTCTDSTTFTTTAEGAIPFGATFTIPIGSAGGAGYLVVEDNVNDYDAVLDYSDFTVTPATLSLAPAFGPFGTSVALSGSGFLPSTTYGYCYDSGASSAPATYSCASPSTFTSDAGGSIPAGTNWNIAPGSIDGWFVVLAQGGTVPAASASFTVTAGSTTTVTTTATATVTEPPTTTTSTVTSVSTATTTSTSTVTLPPVTTTSTATTTQTETQTSTATVTTPTTITSTETSISPTTTTLTTTATSTQTSTVTSPTTTTVTSVSSTTITETSSQAGVPTSDYLICDQTFLNVNQNMNCHATISPADQGALQGGTDGWHATGGTFSQMQCNNPNGQGQIQCQAQFTPTASGVDAITNTFSGDVYHAGSSASFLVFVASQGSPPPPPPGKGVGVAGSSVTSTQVWCDQAYLNLNGPPGPGQNTNCHATISNADGSDATGTVTWSVTGGGTLQGGPPGPAAQCNKPNGQGQIQCQIQYTANTAGPIKVTATYSGTAGHGSSSGSFAIFVQVNNNPVTAISDALIGALKAFSAIAVSFGQPLALLAGTTIAVVSLRRGRNQTRPLS